MTAASHAAVRPTFRSMMPPDTAGFPATRGLDSRNCAKVACGNSRQFAPGLWAPVPWGVQRSAHPPSASAWRVRVDHHAADGLVYPSIRGQDLASEDLQRLVAIVGDAAACLGDQ